MFEAVGLAIELVSDKMVVAPPGVSEVAERRVDELTGQLASAIVEVVLLMAKLSNL